MQLFFYLRKTPERSDVQVAKTPWTLRRSWCDWWARRRAAPRRLAYDVDAAPEARRARRRRRRRDNTLASPRRTVRAALGVGATVEKPVKWT